MKDIEWVGERITELQLEYEQIQTASYGTGLDYDSSAKQKLLSVGGKLTAFKEVLEYLKTKSI